MPIAQGVVAVNVESKFVKGERRIKLDGQAEWYGASADLDERLQPGYEVTLKFGGNGKNLQIEKVKVTGKSETTPTTGASRDDYWAAKDKHDKEVIEPRILYANARDHAIHTVEILHTVGALVLGSSKAKKAGVLQVHIDALTARYYNDGLSQGAVTRYKAEVDESRDLDFSDLETPDDFTEND